MRILAIVFSLVILSKTPVWSQQAGAMKCSEESEYIIEGLLKSNSDHFPILEMEEGTDERPHVGDRGDLHKYFETPFFNSVVKGWMGIAAVEVTSVKGRLVTFHVLEKTSEININGKSKNQFTEGTRVQFGKYEYSIPVVDTILCCENGKSIGTKLCGIPIGEWKNYDSTGVHSETFHYGTNGKREGPVEVFYADGKAKEAGTYSDDRKIGEWTGYHSNGHVSHQHTFVNGIHVGLETFWDENGQRLLETTYNSEGKEDGVRIIWNSKGQILSRNHFSNGEQWGLQEYFYSDGTKSEQYEIHNGIISDKYEKWYANGKRAEVKHFDGQGKKYGLWQMWSENGNQIEQFNYINDIPAGEAKRWFSNGSLLDSGFYNSSGKKEGTWMYYYENGKPKEKISYSNATLHGDYATYNENGKVKVRGQYNFGKEDGDWKESFANGKKKSLGTYINGKKVKTWYYWDESGKKRKEKFI